MKQEFSRKNFLYLTTGMTAVTLGCSSERGTAQDEDARRRDREVTQVEATGQNLPDQPFRPEEFGAVGDGVTDDSAAIQDTIDAAVEAYTAGGRKVVVFGPKTYRAAGLVHRYGTILEGMGGEATKIQAPAGSTAAGVITLAAGPVANVCIRNMEIAGANNPNQHVLYFHAQPSPEAPYHGGMWYGLLQDIVVRGQHPDAHAIWFRGGTNDFSNPHQFIRFEGVRAYHYGGLGRALKMTGQCGQFQIAGTSEFAGVEETVSGVCAEIGWEMQADGLTPAGPRGAYNVVFQGASFQRARGGVILDSSDTVKLRDGYFEALAESITVQGECVSVEVDGNRFANAAMGAALGAGEGQGWILKAHESASVTYGKNHHASNPDGKVLIREGNAEIRCDPELTYGEGSSPPTSGVVETLTAAATLDLKRRELAQVTGATTVTTINSVALPGNIVRIRANGSITFAAGGNINLSGKTSPLTVPDGTIVTFVRSDAVADWLLVGIS